MSRHGDSDFKGSAAHYRRGTGRNSPCRRRSLLPTGGAPETNAESYDTVPDAGAGINAIQFHRDNEKRIPLTPRMTLDLMCFRISDSVKAPGFQLPDIFSSIADSV